MSRKFETEHVLSQLQRLKKTRTIVTTIDGRKFVENETNSASIEERALEIKETSTEDRCVDCGLAAQLCQCSILTENSSRFKLNAGFESRSIQVVYDDNNHAQRITNGDSSIPATTPYRYLVATKDIPAGELLFVEKAHLLVASGVHVKAQICDACHTASPQTSYTLCSTCRRVYLCDSEDCRQAHGRLGYCRLLKSVVEVAKASNVEDGLLEAVIKLLYSRYEHSMASSSTTAPTATTNSATARAALLNVDVTVAAAGADTATTDYAAAVANDEDGIIHSTAVDVWSLISDFDHGNSTSTSTSNSTSTSTSTGDNLLVGLEVACSLLLNKVFRSDGTSASDAAATTAISAISAALAKANANVAAVGAAAGDTKSHDFSGENESGENEKNTAEVASSLLTDIFSRDNFIRAAGIINANAHVVTAIPVSSVIAPAPSIIAPSSTSDGRTTATTASGGGGAYSAASDEINNKGVKRGGSADGGAVFGIFPLLAMANHSCRSNCSFAGVGVADSIGFMQVRTSRDIKKGEELTVNYIGDKMFLRRAERRAFLLENRHFDCRCDYCSIIEVEQGNDKKKVMNGDEVVVEIEEEVKGGNDIMHVDDSDGSTEVTTTPHLLTKLPPRHGSYSGDVEEEDCDDVIKLEQLTSEFSNSLPLNNNSDTTSSADHHRLYESLTAAFETYEDSFLLALQPQLLQLQLQLQLCKTTAITTATATTAEATTTATANNRETTTDTNGCSDTSGGGTNNLSTTTALSLQKLSSSLPAGELALLPQQPARLSSLLLPVPQPSPPSLLLPPATVPSRLHYSVYQASKLLASYIHTLITQPPTQLPSLISSKKRDREATTTDIVISSSTTSALNSASSRADYHAEDSGGIRGAAITNNAEITRAARTTAVPVENIRSEGQSSSGSCSSGSNSWKSMYRHTYLRYQRCVLAYVCAYNRTGYSLDTVLKARDYADVTLQLARAMQDEHRTPQQQQQQQQQQERQQLHLHQQPYQHIQNQSQFSLQLLPQQQQLKQPQQHEQLQQVNIIVVAQSSTSNMTTAAEEGENASELIKTAANTSTNSNIRMNREDTNHEQRMTDSTSAANSVVGSRKSSSDNDGIPRLVVSSANAIIEEGIQWQGYAIRGFTVCLGKHHPLTKQAHRQLERMMHFKKRLLVQA